MDEAAVHEAFDLEQGLDEIIPLLAHITAVTVYPVLGSTNDRAMLLEKENKPSGSLVIACSQDQGRGRMGRSWIMNRGDIAMSLILRPPHLPKNPVLLSMMSAVAICQGLKGLGIDARIKWPNDIVIESPNKDERFSYLDSFLKVGGVLLENVFHNSILKACILGIGLNVMSNEDTKRIVPHAGFLQDFAPSIHRMVALRAILIALDNMIRSLALPLFEEELFRFYESHLVTLGRRVLVSLSSGQIEGLAMRLERDGSLVILSDGQEYSVFAGDVSSRKK